MKTSSVANMKVTHGWLEGRDIHKMRSLFYFVKNTYSLPKKTAEIKR